MGVVYKAFHPELKRTVALKVLIAGEDASVDAIARFHREAEMVAKLGHHPNIVPVYDVGKAERDTASGPGHAAPRHYIAMHYVEGKPLDRLIDEGGITPQRAAQITIQIAKALQHAHAQGILHRDVKPANILLARKGEVSSVECRVSSNEPATEHSSGSFQEPMLTDFGLAKDVESESKMTRSGVTLGTPQYMPPEQADGRLDEIDARSDVYSLGATLYEMLAARPPFEGTTVIEVIQKVMLKDPVSPRRDNPAVERDLETICLKCLEKDPKRRYTSAGALARDLASFLEGEPIAARPASLVYRLRKTFSRNRGIAATALASLVLLLAGGIAGGVLLLRSVRRTEQAAGRADAAELLAVKNSKLAKVLVDAHVRLGRIHATLKDSYYDSRKTVAQKIETYQAHEEAIDGFFRPLLAEKDAARAASPAAASAAFALKGWFLRLRGRKQESLSLFAKAREADPVVGWGYLFEAMAWITEFFDELDLPLCIIGPTGLEFGPMPPETDRMQAARDKFQSLLDGLDGDRIWGVELSGAFRDALEKIRSIGGEDPSAAEAGVSAMLSLSEFFWMEEELLFARADLRYVQGDFEGSLKDIEELLRRSPGSALAHFQRGDLKSGLACAGKAKGEDVRELLKEAAREYGNALGLDPGMKEALVNRGTVYLDLARVQTARGENPVQSWRRSIQDFTEALRLDPELAEAYCNRANAHRGLGDFLFGGGEDPRSSYLSAIRDLEDSLRRDPENPLAHNGLGNAYRCLGEVEAADDLDPRPTYRKAIESFDEALRWNSGDGTVSLNRGIAFLRLGEWEARIGGDPRDLYGKAVEDFNRAVRANPDFTEPYNGRGAVTMALGGMEAARGGDPRGLYRKAVEDFDAVLKRNPEDAGAYNNRGIAHRKLGEAEAARGSDPGPYFRKGIEDFGKVLEKNPAMAPALGSRAALWAMLAGAQAAAGVDPRESYRASIADYDEVFRRDSTDWGAVASRGVARAELGQIEEALGADTREAFREAVRDFREAIRLHPDHPGLYVHLGSALKFLGEAESDAGESPTQSYEEALEAYGEALKRDPGLWQAQSNTGLVLGNMGRYEESVAALEKARAMVGDRVPQLREWIARVRALAGDPSWVRVLKDARSFMKRDDFIGTAALYEKGLSEAEKAGGASVAGARQARILRNAHYNYACVLAVLSKGRRLQGEPLIPCSPAEAEAFRVKAIEQLRKAFELGFDDLAHVRKDPGLEPLRSCPAFEALLKEWEGKLAKGAKDTK